MIEEDSGPRSLLAIDEGDILSEEVFQSLCLFLMSPLHHQSLLPVNEMDDPDIDPFQVLTNVRKVVSSGLGIEEMKACHMAYSVPYRKEPSQAAHGMGGEVDGRIESPQQVGEQIEGEVMASHHDNGVYDLFNGSQEFDLCLLILIQAFG